MKGSKNLFKKSDPNFGSKKINLLLAGSTKQKLLRVAIKFFAQKILHKIPCFWDFTFVFFNKRLSKKINLLLAGSTKQKLLRVAIKFFAQKILHKIPCFWDFTFVFFNKRLSAHHFFCSKNDVMKF